MIFINDYKPDLLDDVKSVFEKEILKRGWILGSPGKSYLRFTTPIISELTYINENSNGWRHKESFLLEFRFDPSKNRMNCKAVIAPSDPNYNTNRLSELLFRLLFFKLIENIFWINKKYYFYAH